MEAQSQSSKETDGWDVSLAVKIFNMKTEKSATRKPATSSRACWGGWKLFGRIEAELAGRGFVLLEQGHQPATISTRHLTEDLWAGCGQRGLRCSGRRVRRWQRNQPGCWEVAWLALWVEDRSALNCLGSLAAYIQMCKTVAGPTPLITKW